MKNRLLQEGVVTGLRVVAVRALAILWSLGTFLPSAAVNEGRRIDLISKYSPILRHWGIRLRHTNSGRTQSSPQQEEIPRPS